MNPFNFPPRQQAKAIAAGLGALLTGLAAGDPIVAVVGAVATFYGTFATRDSRGS